MKKISAWAMRHPAKARLWMIVIKVLLFFEALYMGNELAEWGIHFSDDHFYFILFLFGFALLTYPNTKNKKIYFEYQYYARKKVNDFVIALSSFMVLIVTFNTNFLSPLYKTAEASSIITNSPGIDGTNPAKKSRKFAAKERRQWKANFKKLWKQWKAAMSKNADGKNKGWKLALAITLGIVLTALLALLACAIACNGQEVLAAIILALGLAGVIWGLVAWIKSIYRKRSIARRKRRNKQPAMALHQAE